MNANFAGWSVGSHDIEEGQNRNVAAKTKSVVVSVDYRLWVYIHLYAAKFYSDTEFRAPEYRFPYAINDCYDILLWCKGNASTLGIDPNYIIVSGGSSGANIVSFHYDSCL